MHRARAEPEAEVTAGRDSKGVSLDMKEGFLEAVVLESRLAGRLDVRWVNVAPAGASLDGTAGVRRAWEHGEPGGRRSGQHTGFQHGLGRS